MGGAEGSVNTLDDARVRRIDTFDDRSSAKSVNTFEDGRSGRNINTFDDRRSGRSVNTFDDGRSGGASIRPATEELEEHQYVRQ